MDLCTLALAVALAGQLANPSAVDPRTQPATGLPAAPAETPRQEARAVEVLNDALNLPAQTRATARSVTLLEVLASINDRRARIAATHAYWNLSAAGAQVRFSRDELARLESWRGRMGKPELTQLETALASVRARTHEADAALTQAQFALAEQLAWPLGAPPPLAADPPHVGPYETYFEKLFAASPPPTGLLQLDRTLPIERSLLEARAAAVLAASDALGAALESKDFSQRMRAFDELVRQRRAFIAAVRDYNHDIANYALSVANDGLSREAVVGMLIKIERPSPTQTARGRSPATSRPANSITRTGYDEFVNEYPFLAPAPVEENNEPAIAFPPNGEVTPIEAETEQPQFRESRYSPPESTSAKPSRPASGRRFAALEPLAPPRRAQELAFALHPAPAATNDASPRTLDECLKITSDDRRRPLVDSYWRAAEAIARRNALQLRLAQLESLVTPAMKNGTQPGGADAMLALEMCRANAEAELIAAELNQVNAAFELSRFVGTGASAGAILPASTPHAGRYQLQSASLRSSVRASHTFQRLTREVPALGAALEDSAAAIVSLDRARQDASTSYVAGAAPLQPALDAIDRQSSETLAFLEVARRYNQAIGAYVFHVLPAQTNVEKLTSAMILKRRA